MRPSLMLRQSLQKSIDDEIAERIRKHQARISSLNTLAAALDTGIAAAKPVILLAQGDSWFDYPLSGNSFSLTSTDIIAQLETMGDLPPLILNIAHFGEATSDELSLPKQERMISALQDPANWSADGKPDAILFSGGGNDIAGNQFCIFLDYAIAGGGGLNANRLEKALGMVEASYLDLFAFRDKYASGTPIFAHCYDFPIPNGVHPSCAGPWLKPSLDYAGWNLTQGTGIVRAALLELRNVLLLLASEPANNFTLIDTQGLLEIGDDWANELHPFPGGFKKLALQFVTALQRRFPNRGL